MFNEVSGRGQPRVLTVTLTSIYVLAIIIIYMYMFTNIEVINCLSFLIVLNIAMIIIYIVCLT